MEDKVSIHGQIKAVIFDLDGVLVDTEVIYVKRMKEFYELYGIDISVDVLNAIVGGSLAVNWNILKHFNPKEWDFEFFKSSYREFSASKEFCYLEYLNEGAAEAVTALKQKGYLTALASSSSIERIERALLECHLTPLFASVLSGDMFSESKPNPEIYLKSAKTLGLNPSECAVIEDSYYGIQAGKRAGMTVIAKLDTTFGIDQSQADYFISRLSEIVPLLEDINI